VIISPRYRHTRPISSAAGTECDDLCSTRSLLCARTTR
jgi:hypothetical protein